MEPGDALPCLKVPTNFPYPEPAQSSPCPHPISWKSILILSSHLRLGLPSGHFTSCIPTKTLSVPLLSPMHATSRAHLIRFDLITRIILGEEYGSLSSSLCSLIHSPVISSLFNSKYSPQNPIPKDPQPTFLPQCERTSFTPLHNSRQNYGFRYSNLYLSR